MDEHPLPKHPRLKHFDYKGTFAYSVTICTNNKQKHLLKAEIVSICLETLKQVGVQLNFSILAYCFMPDHLHLLLIGQNQDSNLKSFVKLFKQKSGYLFKRLNPKLQLWQPSYYDHVLRSEEDIEATVRYILGNPVRKALVEDYRQYPYSGSDVFDINHL